MEKATKKPRNELGESSLTLVKGDMRKVWINLPLSDVIRYREEAKARGITLDEFIGSLLNQPRPRGARRTKKPAKR